MATIENISHFMFICPKTNTTTERFYEDFTIIIHYVNINVTNDEKLTLLLSDHRIMKISTNFIIKCIQGRW